jgi:hypothetical protein
VINVAATIEHDLADPFGFRTQGNILAYRLGRGEVSPGAPFALFALCGVRRNQGRACEIVNQLNVYVIQRAIHIQPRPLGGAENLFADALMNVPPVLILRCLSKHFFGPWSFVVGRWQKPPTTTLILPMGYPIRRRSGLANDHQPTTNDGYFAPVFPTFFFKRSPA